MIRRCLHQWNKLKFLEKLRAIEAIGVFFLSIAAFLTTLIIGYQQIQAANKANLLQEKIIRASDEDKKREAIREATRNFELNKMEPPINEK